MENKINIDFYDMNKRHICVRKSLVIPQIGTFVKLSYNNCSEERKHLKVEVVLLNCASVDLVVQACAVYGRLYTFKEIEMYWLKG